MPPESGSDTEVDEPEQIPQAPLPATLPQADKDHYKDDRYHIKSYYNYYYPHHHINCQWHHYNKVLPPQLLAPPSPPRLPIPPPPRLPTPQPTPQPPPPPQPRQASRRAQLRRWGVRRRRPGARNAANGNVEANGILCR